MKLKVNCENCGKPKEIFPSQLKRDKVFFRNRPCHRAYRNKIENPLRDRSGEKNPMWGKHPTAWNKGLIGELSHNWRGGIHKRKDGYVRIRINGKRHLLHRHLLADKLNETNVVHHKDENPSNNSLENLEILPSQVEHARLHMLKRHA